MGKPMCRYGLGGLPHLEEECVDASSARCTSAAYSRPRTAVYVLSGRTVSDRRIG